MEVLGFVWLNVDNNNGTYITSECWNLQRNQYYYSHHSDKVVYSLAHQLKLNVIIALHYQTPLQLLTALYFQ